MRVALVTYAMLWGGMEAFILRLCKFLLKEGLEVDVITTCAKGDWYGKLGEAGIGARHIEDDSLTEAGHAIRVGRILARSGYNAVLLNHARHAQMSLGLLPESAIVIPVLHNDAPEIYEIGCANSQAWNVAVGVSPKVTQEARGRVGGERVEHVAYGIETVPWLRVQNRRSFPATFRLLFAGRLVHSQKGVLLLPSVLRKCLDLGVDARLTIAGDGPDLPLLREALRQNGVQERVEFRGLLAHEDVYETLLNSHVLLMPSFYEGLPIMQLEALACGCVPVVSHLHGITDVAMVDEESGILVKPGDVAGFARAIHSLSACPGRWRSMSASAHAAGERFSVEKMGSSYLRLIEAACAGRYPLPKRRRWQAPLNPSLLRREDFRPRLARFRRRFSRVPVTFVADTSSVQQRAKGTCASVPPSEDFRVNLP